MLQKLPAEIFAWVIEKVANKSDLKRLCEVSKILNSLTVPYLYRDVTIEATDERYLEELDVEPLLRTCSQQISHLSYVKDVRVLSRFHRNLNGRCIHNRYDDVELDEEGDEEGDEDANSFAKLTSNLMPLFRQFNDGSLRSFSWELGTCIPPEILGYLGNKQSSIETLSLITGGSCDENMDGEYSIDLSAFRSLRAISWSNLRSAEDFEALGDVLQTNSAHLTELRLDFVDWTKADESSYTDRGPWNDDGSENFFASDVLELSTGEVVVKFPALEILSLSDVSFKSAAAEMTYAFNLSKLRSLTLRNCPGSGDFLRGVIELGQAIRLISLEVQAGTNEDYDMPEVISTFLEAFEGLENLYVAHSGPTTETITLWCSMVHHKSTLAKFAYHQRAVDLDQDSSHYEEDCDLLDLSLVGNYIVELTENSLHHPLQELNLECIALSCDAYYLKPILVPFVMKHTLKILHIRRSGSELARLPSLNTLIERERDSNYIDDDTSDDNISPGHTSEHASSDDDASSDHPVSDITNTSGSGQSLRLLKGLGSFANWAFGSEGFPVLDILAFGDFSYQGRFSRDTLLLCRNKSSSSPANPDATQPYTALTFREMRKNDRALWDLLKRNSDFLEACPTDSILAD